jgi:hypothetical protein
VPYLCNIINTQKQKNTMTKKTLLKFYAKGILAGRRLDYRLGVKAVRPAGAAYCIAEVQDNKVVGKKTFLQESPAMKFLWEIYDRGTIPWDLTKAISARVLAGDYTHEPEFLRVCEDVLSLALSLAEEGASLDRCIEVIGNLFFIQDSARPAYLLSEQPLTDLAFVRNVWWEVSVTESVRSSEFSSSYAVYGKMYESKDGAQFVLRVGYDALPDAKEVSKYGINLLSSEVTSYNVHRKPIVVTMIEKKIYFSQ